MKKLWADEYKEVFIRMHMLKPKLLIVLSAFMLAYFPVWKRLAFSWFVSDDHSHGLLIVPLSLYVLWRKREVLAKIRVSPSAWGLLLIVFSLLVYLFAHLGEIVTLASLSMIPLLAGVIIYLHGLPMLKELLFPLFLLLLMVPVPSQVYSSLTMPFQLLVSKTGAFIAGVLGIPVYREGNMIHLPDGTMQVVRACSGLRSVISLLTLSAILGYFTLKSNLLRAVLFFSGIPAAFVINVTRVSALVVAFYYLNYDLTTGRLHTVFGMIIFCIGAVLLIAFKGILSNWEESVPTKLSS